MFGKRNKKIEKPKQSYVTLHNRAVTRYKQAAKILIWAGVLNFVGLIISIVQFYTSEDVNTIQYYFCFGVNDFLFTLLETKASLNTNNPVLFWIIVSVMTIGTTVGSTLISLFASQGKKKFLISCLAAYFTDWVFVFLAYFVSGETTQGLLLSGGIHIIITFFLIVAAYQYRNVLEIEKRFEKPKVEEQKEAN